MRTMKTTVGLIAAAIPVIYCGGFLLYFGGVRNAFGGMVDRQLGPTMLGLAAFGLLFLILFAVKILKLFRGAGAPGAGTGGGRPDKAPKEEGSEFDPDAAIARYLAQRGSGPRDPASPHGGGGPVRPGGFGRRGA